VHLKRRQHRSHPYVVIIKVGSQRYQLRPLDPQNRLVRFEVSTAAIIKNVFWDVTPYGSVRTDDSEEDGGDTFLRNVGSYKSHKASHPRRRYSSQKCLFVIRCWIFHIVQIRDINNTYKILCDLNKQDHIKKNTVYWNESPRGSCKNRRFGRMYRLYHQDEENQQTTNNVSSN
jgi:hypothetical protein